LHADYTYSYKPTMTIGLFVTCIFGFAKVHHEIIPRGKSGHGLMLGKLPNILELIIFLQWLKLAS